MKKQATVKGLEVVAKLWEGYGKRKVYFTIDFPASAGSARTDQACYDLDRKEFTDCKANMMKSHKFDNLQIKEWKEALIAAFEL
jgi:hypothetical protein